MSDNAPMIPCENRGELLFFQTDGQSPKLEVRLHNESVWLSLSQAQAHGTEVPGRYIDYVVGVFTCFNPICSQGCFFVILYFHSFVICVSTNSYTSCIIFLLSLS